MLPAIKEGTSDELHHEVADSTVATFCHIAFRKAIAVRQQQLQKDEQRLNNIGLLAHFFSLRPDNEIRKRIIWSVNNQIKQMKIVIYIQQAEEQLYKMEDAL